MEAEGIELQRVEAVRALVQAFEDGASEGVGKKDADKGMGGKRKGTVHFLASVFANISMVSLPPPPTAPLLWLLSLIWSFRGTDRCWGISVGPLDPPTPPPPIPGVPAGHHPGDDLAGGRTPPHQDCRLHRTPGYDPKRRRVGVYKERGDG